VRVLHVMEATIGGTRRHLVDVASGQRARGLDVHLAVSAEREPRFLADLDRLAAQGCRIERVPMVRAVRPATDLAHGRRLAAILRRVRPDVVHTHSSKAGVLGRCASIATGIGARVHTPHTFAFLFEAMFGPLRRRLFREIEAGLAQHTHAIVAVSPSEARTFVASGVVSAERVRVVANGIDPAPWAAARPLDRAAIGAPAEAPLAAVVGLLNDAKGQDLAIDALAEPGLEELRLAIVGAGEARTALERRAEARGVLARVRFLGWRDDVPELLAASDFVLLPSRWEGMPYVVLEAMAAARPVVATPVDGAVDLLDGRGTGLVADAIGAAALARRVRELCALPAAERRAMGERGRELVRGTYTLERMVAGLVAVYESVL
jgi:glycosyltransferase involved in cell wall biosynthesis